MALHSAPVLLRLTHQSSALIRPTKALHSRSNDPSTKRSAQVAKLPSTSNEHSALFKQAMAGPRKGSLDEIDQMLLDAADGIFEVEIKIEDTVKTNPRKPKHICADCNKTYASAKALGNHYLRTHLEGDSPCEHCTTDQSCARHHVYYNWVRMSSDPKPHQCLLCSECFGTPTTLRAHQCSARPGNRRKSKESSRRTIVRVETTPVPDSERAHYGMPWPAPTRQWGPAPALAPAPAAQDDRMRIAFVLQNDRRMDVDFVPLD